MKLLAATTWISFCTALPRAGQTRSQRQYHFVSSNERCDLNGDGVTKEQVRLNLTPWSKSFRSLQVLDASGAVVATRDSGIGPLFGLDAGVSIWLRQIVPDQPCEVVLGGDLDVHSEEPVLTIFKWDGTELVEIGAVPQHVCLHHRKGRLLGRRADGTWQQFRWDASRFQLVAEPVELFAVALSNILGCPRL